MSNAVISQSNQPEIRGDLSSLFLESNLDKLHVPESQRDEIRNHVVKGVGLDTSTNGVPILSLHGTPLYDTRDPIGVTEKQIADIEAPDRSTIVVLFGLGLGYHAEQLERRFRCPIIIYEPSLDVIRFTLSMRPLPLERTLLVTNEAYLLHETQPRLQF